MGNPILRVRLHTQQKGKCHYCKIQMSIKVEGEFFCTIDHKTTRSRGGGSHPENVVGACFRCNNLRGDIPYWAFKLYIDIYGPVNIKQTLLALSRDDYLRYKEMWDAIRTKQNVRKYKPSLELTAPIIVVPRPPSEGYKPRRAILHLTRRNLKENVDNIPFEQRNILWGKYLKQEKLNGQANSHGEQRPDDPFPGSSMHQDAAGWHPQPHHAFLSGGIWGQHGPSGGDLPAPPQ